MSQPTILIVDDDASIRKVLGFILEEAGYTVRTESSGASAIAAIEAERPDLVLTDIKMPGMDGITLLGKVKEIDHNIPVIVLTAFGSVETAVEAMKLGAIDYLTKPVSRDELTLTVKKNAPDKTARKGKCDAKRISRRKIRRYEYHRALTGHAASV